MLRRQSALLFGLALLLSVSPMASALAPKECATLTSPRGHRYEIGLLYQAIIPSGLPDLSRTIPVYGPIVGVPVLGGTVQLQTVWGSDDSAGISLNLVEANYRLEIEIPFLNVFALFGAHYLRYTLATTTHAGFGANLGIGLSFLMGKNFEVSLSLRTYLQQRSTVSFGGGFAFLL